MKLNQMHLTFVIGQDRGQSWRPDTQKMRIVYPKDSQFIIFMNMKCDYNVVLWQ